MTKRREAVYVGLDIGGTKLMVAAADAQGQILASTQAPTPLELKAGLNQLHAMIAEVTEGRTLLGMGAAAGGPLDQPRGIVSPLHQPEWREVPLKELMEARWKVPFQVDIDTNVAALAEYRFGGSQASRLLYLTVSTGMGGGFLVDGAIYRGVNGSHPEAGHQAIPFRCSHPERIACECGAPDCLEALVSGNAIRRIYGRPATELSEEEWSEVEWNLGQGIRNLSALYAPEVVVLGGGVACGRGEALLDGIRRVLAAHLRLVPQPVVALSRLGTKTALMGAVAVAIHGLTPAKP